MRTLTLLELLVEWETLPLTSFIVVWIPVTSSPTSEVFPRWWQKLCVVDCMVRRETIDDAIRMSPILVCEIHTDPKAHYGWTEPTRACWTCKRPMHQHFTDMQVEQILAETSDPA